jgi:hypothetical protein
MSSNTILTLTVIAPWERRWLVRRYCGGFFVKLGKQISIPLLAPGLQEGIGFGGQRGPWLAGTALMVFETRNGGVPFSQFFREAKDKPESGD